MLMGPITAEIAPGTIHPTLNSINENNAIASYVASPLSRILGMFRYMEVLEAY